MQYSRSSVWTKENKLSGLYNRWGKFTGQNDGVPRRNLKLCGIGAPMWLQSHYTCWRCFSKGLFHFPSYMKNLTTIVKLFLRSAFQVNKLQASMELCQIDCSICISRSIHSCLYLFRYCIANAIISCLPKNSPAYLIVIGNMFPTMSLLYLHFNETIIVKQDP